MWWRLRLRANRFLKMLRVETSFQDSPDRIHFFALYYEGRPLEEQLAALGLRNGDKVILWEEECDYEVEATLLFDFRHPMGMPYPALWAKASSD